MSSVWYDGALFRESSAWEWQPDTGRLRIFSHNVRPGVQEQSEIAAAGQMLPLQLINSGLNRNNVNPIVYWWKDKLTVENDYLVDADFTTKRKQYLARGDVQGYVMPGIRASFTITVHFWDNLLYKVSESELLLASHGALRWEHATDGAVPASALPTGMAPGGVPIYTARVRRGKTAGIGTILQGEVGCRVVTGVAEELIFTKYEVLCLASQKKEIEIDNKLSAFEQDTIAFDLPKSSENTTNLEDHINNTASTSSACRDVTPPDQCERSENMEKNQPEPKRAMNREVRGPCHANDPHGYTCSNIGFSAQMRVMSLNYSGRSYVPIVVRMAQNVGAPGEARGNVIERRTHEGESEESAPRNTHPNPVSVCSPNSRIVDGSEMNQNDPPQSTSSTNEMDRLTGSVNEIYANNCDDNKVDCDYMSQPKKFKSDHNFSEENETNDNDPDGNRSAQKKEEHDESNQTEYEQEEIIACEPVQNISQENEMQQNVSELEIPVEYGVHNTIHNRECDKSTEDSEHCDSEMNKNEESDSQHANSQENELQLPECEQNDSVDNKPNDLNMPEEDHPVQQPLNLLPENEVRNQQGNEAAVNFPLDIATARAIDDIEQMLAQVSLPWVSINSQANVHDLYVFPGAFDSKTGPKLNLSRFPTANDMDVSANEARPAASGIERQLPGGGREHVLNIGFDIWNPAEPNHLQRNQDGTVSNEFHIHIPLRSDHSDAEAGPSGEHKGNENDQSDGSIDGKNVDRNSDHGMPKFGLGLPDQEDREEESDEESIVEEEIIQDEAIPEDEINIPWNNNLSVPMPQWRHVDGYSLQDFVVSGETVFGGRGPDGQDLWVSRFSHHGHLLPDAHDRGDMASFLNPLHLEMLLVPAGSPFAPRWVPARDGDVPAGAFPAGFTMDGEEAYVARARHDGHLIPGRLVASEGGCVIRDTLQMQIVLCTEYEVLTFC